MKKKSSPQRQQSPKPGKSPASRPKGQGAPSPSSRPEGRERPKSSARPEDSERQSRPARREDGERPKSSARPESRERPQSSRQAPPARRSHASGREGLFINNWSALSEYLQSQSESLIRIFHAPREARRIQEALAKHGVEVPCEEDPDLETGFAANVKVRYKDEEQLLQDAARRTDDLIIACDHVTDTRNLGAIARTAAFFGLSTLLVPKDRQAPITSATLGTAQGAFASVTPVEVTNLGRTLLALKDCGYWIASADMVGMPVDKLPTRYEKMVLVLGSEDKGVSTQVLNKSDFTLSIPSFGGKLESLNVSVAAGILIHALRAQSAPGKILPPG